MFKVLPKDFYLDDDVVKLSRDLLGKFLLTKIGNKVTGGIIIETEAYRGPEDRASHAYGNRRTNRTEVMFHEGGKSYVYLCYGIHHLFNVVTNVEGIPHAILVRGLLPVIGIDHMSQRRKKQKSYKNLTIGPGSLSQALGITTDLSGLPLFSSPIWIEDRGVKVPPNEIEIGTRIGIDYAGEDALLPWRFTVCPETARDWI